MTAPGLRSRSLCLCCLGAGDISYVTAVLLISSVLVISCSHYFYKIETKAFCSLLDDSHVVGSLRCLGLPLCLHNSLNVISANVQCSRDEGYVLFCFCTPPRAVAHQNTSLIKVRFSVCACAFYVCVPVCGRVERVPRYVTPCQRLPSFR